MVYFRTSVTADGYQIDRHKCEDRYNGNKCTDSICIGDKHRYWVVMVDKKEVHRASSAKACKEWVAENIK